MVEQKDSGAGEVDKGGERTLWPQEGRAEKQKVGRYRNETVR